MSRIYYCCCASRFGAAFVRKEQQEAELPIEMFDVIAYSSPARRDNTGNLHNSVGPTVNHDVIRPITSRSAVLGLKQSTGFIYYF